MKDVMCAHHLLQERKQRPNEVQFEGKAVRAAQNTILHNIAKANIVIVHSKGF